MSKWGGVEGAAGCWCISVNCVINRCSASSRGERNCLIIAKATTIGTDLWSNDGQSICFRSDGAIGVSRFNSDSFYGSGNVDIDCS